MADPIELNESQIAVLGRPNFACAQIAQLLIRSGVYAKGPKKAEYEQAVYIHWASKLLENHGARWADEGDNILRGLLQESNDE